MRAVVFDLDGTLVDSLPDIAAAVNHCLAAKGLAALQHHEVKAMIGDGARVLVGLAFAARGATAEEADHAAFTLFYNAHAADLTQAYPGMVATLETLRASGRKLAVCTNKPIKAATALLADLKLDWYFDAVIGGDSTPYRKPDPRHLAAALAAINTADGIMVGDHHNDLAAAAGLGLPAIFANWGYGAAEATHVAQNPAEIPALVQSLG